MGTEPLIGQNLDEYRLLSLLGKGGMARVYLGLDVRLKRYASIKVIDTPFRADPSYVRRFELEAQAVAQLDHPNIVRLYRYGEARGLLYMAMQYIEGADFDSVLESYRRNGDLIPSQDANRIIRELCLALDYGHGRGVIHRDVKPSNIILNGQGHPYLTDFGLALFAEPETRAQVFGTPHYMAPEQVTPGAGATPQSDLYAVGIILYQMFTGELPFDDPDPMAVAKMQVNKAPHPPRELRPEISPEVQSVIVKAMAKAPGDRYPTGAALADALDHALAVTAAGSQSPLPTLPYLSIPDRVTVELTRNPPPALPAAENAMANVVEIPRRDAPLPRRSVPSVPRRVRAMPSRRRPPAVSRRAIGCLAALIVVLALTAGAYWVVREGSRLRDNPDWSWLFNLPKELPWLSAPTQVPALPEPTAMPTPTPAPTLAPEPTAPPAAQTYQLVVVLQGEDSLVLVNGSEQPFPMGPLRLGDGEGAINGSEWGIGSLSQNACVIAIKDGPPAVHLPQVNCDFSDRPVVRRKKDVFWNSGFNIYYNNQAVTTCREDRCPFEVTVGP